ncbi:MAG TPA: TlpA disulfide reductase family protein [Chthonomonadaceae bacterium]|nr:TlpA disulfide reductase family protein [Chthonomonadaceae bacterium]
MARKVLMLSALFALIIGVLYYLGNQPSPVNEAPDVALPLQSYHLPTRLSGFRGKVVLLDFWATWCQPCRLSIPEIARLYDKYKDRGLVVIGVSVDTDPSGVPATERMLGMHYPVIFESDAPEVGAAYPHNNGIPTMYLIDKHGNLSWHQDGYTGQENLEEKVTQLLND